ncbi:hypothetical protein L1D16_22360, partial [Vibrio sp. Isolate31]|uniref:hypothetical protein n=1 Tax=Vibrio sp. Isolate31 TaxID=2908537 RepID=UPI001EFE50ED
NFNPDIIVTNYVRKSRTEYLEMKESSAEVGLHSKNQYLHCFFSSKSCTALWNKLIKKELLPTTSYPTWSLGEDLYCNIRAIINGENVYKSDIFSIKYNILDSSLTQNKNCKNFLDLYDVFKRVEGSKVLPSDLRIDYLNFKRFHLLNYIFSDVTCNCAGCCKTPEWLFPMLKNIKPGDVCLFKKWQRILVFLLSKLPDVIKLQLVKLS